jgi:anti-sigma factor RsiW
MSENAHPIPTAWLAAYYDGELEPARREQLEAHLAVCAECQSELAALRSLSETLTTDELTGEALSDGATFWQALERRLPDRTPASAALPARNVLVRWLPGISLLVLNGALQTAALAATALMFVLPQVRPAAAWSQGVNSLATGVTLGWLAWLLPAAWTGLGIFMAVAALSASLMIAYMAWLAYEWRYGAKASQHALA